MRAWILRLLAALAIAAAIVIGRPFLRPPAAQALEQQKHLLALAEQRNWKAALPLLAPDYRDAWDQDRVEALASARDLFRGFLRLELQWKPDSVLHDGKTARVRGFVRLEGSGTGFAGEIVSALRRLEQPFTFTWRKDGWKPGDWRLTGVTQPELAPAEP